MTTATIISAVLIAAGVAGSVIAVLIISLRMSLGNERRAMRAIIYALIISVMLITAGVILVGAA